MDTAVNRRSVLVVTTLSSFLTAFMSSSVSIALPSIGKEFVMDAVLLSWIPASYLLASAMFLVPFGRTADIYGRKRLFTYGTVIYTVSSLLCGISSSGGELIAFRVMQGIGASMVFGTSTAILTSAFAVGERGKVLGVNVAAVYTGLSLGPFLGGLLTQHLGWRSVFLMNVPCGLIIVALVFWMLKEEWIEAKDEKFDFAGSIIYGITLLAIMYGFSLLPRTSGALLLLTGVVGLVAFVTLETKVESPVLDVKVFRNNRVFAFSNLAALINYSATFAVSFLLSIYLQYVKGLSPQSAGLILVSQPITQTIFSPFAGRLSDRIEPQIVASIGMTFTAIGLSMVTFLSEGTGFEFIIASLVLLGFGFALFSSPNTNAVMSSVEKKSYGVASSTLATMRLTGQMLSMGITTLIFSIYIGRIQITPEYYSLLLKSTRIAFVVFAGLCFCGVFASLARGRVR